MRKECEDCREIQQGLEFGEEGSQVLHLVLKLIVVAKAPSLLLLFSLLVHELVLLWPSFFVPSLGPF